MQRRKGCCLFIVTAVALFETVLALSTGFGTIAGHNGCKCLHRWRQRNNTPWVDELTATRTKKTTNVSNGGEEERMSPRTCLGGQYELMVHVSTTIFFALVKQEEKKPLSPSPQFFCKR
ncbi:hypothetical protein DVH24_016196 [Malus domestica]|uniref:Secreted protein n=1 Tax=Malus domestica TaxID=3750 RepID=A0A498JE49_MALDO|nr:hypothetical protein DVH24_016196 [Malus domestica]